MENRRPQRPQGFGQSKYPTQPRGGSFARGTGRDGSQNRSDGRYRTKASADKMPPRRDSDRHKAGQRPWARTGNIRITSELQITDGKHRGQLLKTIDSPKMKPTPARVRELVFKILARRVRAVRFLDLCSGCGMVGFEAISRGAMLCTFVERSARMCTAIRKNMERCGIKPGHGEVIETEAAGFLKQMLKKHRKWNVVYFAPTTSENNDDILRFLARGAGIAPGGTLVIEHLTKIPFPEKIGMLKRGRVLTIEETSLSFYERK